METNIVVLTGIPPQTTHEDLYVTLDPVAGVSIEYILHPFIYDVHTAIIKLKNNQDVSQLLVGQYEVNGQPVRVRPVPIQVYEECTSTVSPVITSAMGNTAAVKRHLEADLGVKVMVNNGRLTVTGSLLQLQCAQARISDLYHRRQEQQQRKLFQLGVSNEFSASLSDSFPAPEKPTESSMNGEGGPDPQSKPVQAAWAADNLKSKPSESPRVSLNLGESVDSNVGMSQNLAASQTLADMTSESMDLYQELLRQSITSKSLILPSSAEAENVAENLSNSMPTKLGSDRKLQSSMNKQKQSKAPVVKRNTLVSPHKEERVGSPLRNSRNSSMSRKTGTQPGSLAKRNTSSKHRSMDEIALKSAKQDKSKLTRSSPSALTVQNLSLDIKPSLPSIAEKKKGTKKMCSSQTSLKNDSIVPVTLDLDKHVFHYLILKSPGMLAEIESDYRVQITPHIFDDEMLLDIEALDEIFAISAELAKDKLMNIYQKVFPSVKKENIVVEPDPVKEKLLEKIVNQVTNDYKNDLVVDLSVSDEGESKVILTGKKFYVTAAFEYISKMMGSKTSPANSFRQVQTAKDIPKPQMVFMMHSQPALSKRRLSQTSSKHSADESMEHSNLEKSSASVFATSQDNVGKPNMQELQATVRGFYDSLDPGAMGKYAMNTLDPLSQSNYLAESQGNLGQSGTLTHSHSALNSTRGSAYEEAAVRGLSMGDHKPLRFTTREGLHVTLSVGNLTEKEVDVIVNPAREDLHLTHGVSAALSDAAGPDLQMECTRYIVKNGLLHSSEVIHTGAGTGSLQCKQIVHAVVPMWCLHPDKVRGYEVLLNTVLNSFTLSNNGLKATSLATPILGSGLFGVPVEVCGQVLWDAIHEYSENMLEKATLKVIDIVDINPAIVEQIQTYWHDLLQLEPGDHLSSSSQIVPNENHQMVSSGPQMTSSGEQNEAITRHPLLKAASEISPIQSMDEGMRHSKEAQSAQASARDSRDITRNDPSASVTHTPRHLLASEDYTADPQNDAWPRTYVGESLDEEGRQYGNQSEPSGTPHVEDHKRQRQPSTSRSVVRSSVGEMMTPRDGLGGALTLSGGMNATMDDTPYSSINRLDVHQFVGQYVSDTIMGAIGTMNPDNEADADDDAGVDPRASVDTRASRDSGANRTGDSGSILNGVELFEQTMLKTVVDSAELPTKEDQNNNNSAAVLEDVNEDTEDVIGTGENTGHQQSRGTTLDFLMNSFGAVKDRNNSARSSPHSKHSTPRTDRSIRSTHYHHSCKSDKQGNSQEKELVEACKALVSQTGASQDGGPQVESERFGRDHSGASSRASVNMPKSSENGPTPTHSARIRSRDATPRGSSNSAHSVKNRSINSDKDAPSRGSVQSRHSHKGATPRGSIHSTRSSKNATPRGSVHSVQLDKDVTPRGSVHSLHSNVAASPGGSVHNLPSNKFASSRESVHSTHSDQDETPRNSIHDMNSGDVSHQGRFPNEDNNDISPSQLPVLASDHQEVTGDTDVTANNDQSAKDSVPLINPWASPSGDISSRTDKFNFDNLLTPKTPKTPSSISSTPRSARAGLSQPKGGRINWEVDRRIQLPGYDDVGAIVVTYSFPAGKVKGLNYSATTKQAYLPNTPQGRKVLQGLRKAFLLGLVFKLHKTSTGGEMNWADIPHKTDIDGVNGYPDVTYIDAVMTSLKGLELI